MKNSYFESAHQRVRDLSAIGFAAVSLAAAYPEQSLAAQDIDNATVPEQIKALPHKILLEGPKDFNTDHGLVTILWEHGFDLQHSTFNTNNVKREVKSTIDFAESKNVFDITLIAPKSNESLHYKVRVMPNSEKIHGFIFVKDPTAVAELAKYPTPIPAATVFDLAKHRRVTILSPIGDRDYRLDRWNPKMNKDYFDLATESCNNLMDINLTPESNRQIHKLFGTPLPAGIKDVFIKLSHEAVCNSYGLAATAAQANLTYSQYKLLAQENSLNKSVSLNFQVPYVQFSSAQYRQLSRKS